MSNSENPGGQDERALNEALNRLARQAQAQQLKEMLAARAETVAALGSQIDDYSSKALAAVSTVNSVFAPAITLEQQFSGTQAALGLGADAPQLAALRTQAGDLSISMGINAQEIAELQTSLAQSGADADAILNTTAPALNLSAISGLKAEESAGILTDLQSAFDAPDDAGAAMADALTQGAREAGLSIQAFSDAMNTVAPQAKAAGAGFAETAAIVATLAQHDVSPEGAGAVLARLKTSRPALDALGVQQTDAAGQPLPITDMLKDINEAFARQQLSPAQQSASLIALFGKQQAAGVGVLVAAAGEGTLALPAETAGAAARGAALQQDNSNGDLQKLSAAGSAVLSTVFSQQDESLRALIQTATDWMSTLNQWIQQNPQLSGTLMTLVGAVTLIGGALGTLGGVFGPVFSGISMLMSAASLLAPAFTTLGGVIAGAFGVASAPLLAIVGIAAAVVAAIVGGALLIRKYWEPISAFMAGVAEGFSIAFAPVKEMFAPLAPLFEGIGNTVKSLYNGFMNFLTPIKLTSEGLGQVSAAGKNFAEFLLAPLKTALQLMNSLGDGVDWVLEKLGLAKKGSENLSLPSGDTATPGSLSVVPPLTHVTPLMSGGNTVAADNRTFTQHIQLNLPEGQPVDPMALQRQLSEAFNQQNQQQFIAGLNHF
ncbi:phage tail tape measure protein [Chimaeribacter arupi]|uniref:phage tail tape measure protein n=1 Tax=Chimaeribacter arupi TaxID=2060066 RepID=UPI000C7E003C|nr:phage tail tape measure protein [Chimaeribacter arupi]PLR33187.1 phage tail tape measure protein [Chimaeribacter arupi]